MEGLIPFIYKAIKERRTRSYSRCSSTGSAHHGRFGARVEDGAWDSKQWEAAGGGKVSAESEMAHRRHRSLEQLAGEFPTAPPPQLPPAPPLARLVPAPPAPLLGCLLARPPHGLPPSRRRRRSPAARAPPPAADEFLYRRAPSGPSTAKPGPPWSQAWRQQPSTTPTPTAEARPTGQPCDRITTKLPDLGAALEVGRKLADPWGSLGTHWLARLPTPADYKGRRPPPCGGRERPGAAPPRSAPQETPGKDNWRAYSYRSATCLATLRLHHCSPVPWRLSPPDSSSSAGQQKLLSL
ncbi:hypothetical protein BAE44_0002275 [Dichanthelium oligosanthes]|uniref:Uncharacterized protein n=1 Tax=Dichanthelium oligosanthes TaxID=888268 RepID=A0A1E5WH82_9POAL|nr:hypothetical protein BAE44_0002275 [Dichanthelium oligosanthes]